MSLRSHDPNTNLSHTEHDQYVTLPCKIIDKTVISTSGCLCGWISPCCWLLGCETEADRSPNYLPSFYVVCFSFSFEYSNYLWFWHRAIRLLLLQRLQWCLLLSENWQEGVQECCHIPVTLASWVDGQYCGLVHWADCREAKYSMNTSKSAESNGPPLWQWRHFPQGWIAIPMRTQVTAF